MIKEIKDLRIALAGSAGVGKTTLLESWHKKYDVPIARISTVSMMPEGINTHLDILRMATHSPSEGVKFQSSLIIARSALFEKFKNENSGFISDRSVADSWSYFAVHNSMFATKEEIDYLAVLTKKSLIDTDLTVILNPDIINITDNGIRVTSLAYYKAISSVIHNSIIYQFLSTDYTPELVNFNVNDILAQLIIYNDTSVCIINEMLCKNGIALNEDRIKIIEKAAQHLLIVRNN